MGETILSSAIKRAADLPYRFMNDAYDGQPVVYCQATAREMDKIGGNSLKHMIRKVSFRGSQNGGVAVKQSIVILFEYL